MKKHLLQTAERVSCEAADNYVFQRSVLAYQTAATYIQGKVLEIGTGSGYGIDHIAGKASEFITIDKYDNHLDLSTHPHVRFIQMKFPQPDTTLLPSGYFDFVISFQVIEHIKNDRLFLQEVKRVLKPQGRLILTTPNGPMSLTRNPWHVREYSAPELSALLSEYFKISEELGVFGHEKVQDYYRKNKASVRKITRFDFLNLQYRLPRCLLQLPYDLLNHLNRKKLLNQNPGLVSQITRDDYYIAPVAPDCFDLFYIAEKR